MKNKFDNYLRCGLSEYDATYLNDYKYVMLLYKNNEIKSYFANLDYMFFIEYPDDNKDYSKPDMVLSEQMNLTGCEAGIIYENIDDNGNFQPIAFIDKIQNKNYDGKVKM